MNKEQILKAIAEEWEEYENKAIQKLKSRQPETMTAARIMEEEFNYTLRFHSFMNHLTKKYGHVIGSTKYNGK